MIDANPNAIEELVDRSQRCQVLAPVRDALTYLCREFPTQVPEAPVRRAWDLPVSRLEAESYRRSVMRRSRLPPLRWLREMGWLYRVACHSQRRGGNVVDFFR
jgi:hypothetical protein